MLNALDKEVVLGQVLPQLAGLQSREPAVLMSTLGIYHAVFHSKKFTVTRQFLASSVIPHLLSLSLASSLNVTQVSIGHRLTFTVDMLFHTVFLCFCIGLLYLIYWPAIVCHCVLMMPYVFGMQCMCRQFNTTIQPTCILQSHTEGFPNYIV